jgi:hypothetical protein
MVSKVLERRIRAEGASEGGKRDFIFSIESVKAETKKRAREEEEEMGERGVYKREVLDRLWLVIYLTAVRHPYLFRNSATCVSLSTTIRRCI